MRIEACAVCQRRFGFLQGFTGLFRIDPRQQLDLLYLQSRLGQIALGHFDFGLVLGPCGAFFGFFLQYVVREFAILRLFVQEVA